MISQAREYPERYPSELVVEFANAALSDNKHVMLTAWADLVENIVKPDAVGVVSLGKKFTTNNGIEPLIGKFWGHLYNYGVPALGISQTANLVDLSCTPIEAKYRREQMSVYRSTYETAGMLGRWYGFKTTGEFEDDPKSSEAALRQDNLRGFGYALNFWRHQRSAHRIILGSARSVKYARQYNRHRSRLEIDW